MTYVITTTDSAATQAVAAKLAPHLKGGEAVELASDLGGGKTTFVQGLMRALGYNGPVTSPTFALSQVYALPSGLEVHHYDLYRLAEGGVVGEELAEDLRDPQVVTVIEWAGIVSHELPADRLRIEFMTTGDTDRELRLSAGGPVSTRLLQGVQA